MSVASGRDLKSRASLMSKSNLFAPLVLGGYLSPAVVVRADSPRNSDSIEHESAACWFIAVSSVTVELIEVVAFDCHVIVFHRVLLSRDVVLVSTLRRPTKA